MKINSDRLAFGLFIASIVLLAFGYGIAAGKYKLFPYAAVHDALTAFKTQLDRPHHLSPIRYDSVGTQIHDRKSIAPGVTLLTSYWPETDWKPGIRIIDTDGNKLHHWIVDPAELWPTSPHTDAMAGQKNEPSNYIHGTYLFSNGDVLFNIEYLGLIRLDACGQVVWKLPYRTHHSISRDEDGNFWVSGAKWVDVGSERAAAFFGLLPPFFEETALKVSPDGEILSELSLLKALFDGGYQHLLWRYKQRSGDVTHLNDVEALSSDLANQYPLFTAGDLVVSLKHISTVAVLDQSGKIKWLKSEPFYYQHDPDFEDDGWIVVFDNRTDGSDTGEYLGGSVISAINPASGETRQLYPTEGSSVFFTDAGGKHQLLENGNRLITEARAGHVFEIDHTGRIVWEWFQQPFDAELVPEVLEGSRYNLSPEAVARWPCKG